MHVPPAFRLDRATSLAFAARRGFGLVVAHDGVRPVASPLPFHLDYASDGTPRAQFHVARANPLAALAASGGTSGGDWLIAVAGADAYVSPGWYVSPDQVPTWLYEAVHLSGPARVLPDVRAHLDRITEAFEPTAAGVQPWRADRVTPGRLAAMAQAIVAVEVAIEEVDGSAKLNQTKSDADFAAVALRLRESAEPMARQISDRMVALRPHLSYEREKDVCDA